MRLSEVAQLAFARIDTARRHRVQAWLPQMRPRTLDQRHRRPQAPSQTIAKAGDEFQARCPAPDDDDAVQGRLASAQRRRLGARIGPTYDLIAIRMQYLGHWLHSG